MANDLTFNQLSNALPAGSIIVDSTHGVMLKASAITGDSIDDLNDTGVVETLFKLVRAANQAQNVVNQNASAGQRLNAFPAPVPSTPTIGANNEIRARMTVSVVAEMPVDPNAAIGPEQ